MIFYQGAWQTLKGLSATKLASSSFTFIIHLDVIEFEAYWLLHTVCDMKYAVYYQFKALQPSKLIHTNVQYQVRRCITICRRVSTSFRNVLNQFNMLHHGFLTCISYFWFYLWEYTDIRIGHTVIPKGINSVLRPSWD